MKQVPNYFTLLNLVFGCIAIIVTLQNGFIIYSDPQNGQQFLRIPESIALASVFIGLAAVVDFLDGFLARLLRADSEMGKQLDSLADVVSFGVAPGMIMYQFLRLAIAAEPDGLDSSVIWLLPALLLPVAAAWRLARFNIDTDQKYYFKGLPAPAGGLLIASLPLIYWHGNVDTAVTLLQNKWVLYAIILFTMVITVSTLPLLSLKFKDFTFKNNIPKVVLLAVAVAAGIFTGWLAIPLVIIAYILLSLAFKNSLA